MFIVDDPENEQMFGPYESEKAAEADILKQAIKNGWPEIMEAATHAGWLSDMSTALPGQRFGSIGLKLVELIPPEA